MNSVIEGGAKEKISEVGSFVSQLANMEFDNALIYLLLIAAAALICFMGYKIYKYALIAIGFVVGYTRAHLITSAFNISDEHMLMAQLIVGLICAVLAGMVVHIGIFIAAYHFAQANIAAILAAMLAEKITAPTLFQPIITRVLGVVIAAVVAWLAVKSERIVVIVLTAVIGGFAIVNFFVRMVPAIPIDVTILLSVPAIVWTVIKVGLSFAGFSVQNRNN